jgi:hypothetical protein
VSKVLAMPEFPARNDQREIRCIMARRVPHSCTYHRKRMVQQSRWTITGLFHPLQEFAPLSQQIPLKDCRLVDLVRVLAVMAEIVVREVCSGL